MSQYSSLTNSTDIDANYVSTGDVTAYGTVDFQGTLTSFPVDNVSIRVQNGVLTGVTGSSSQMDPLFTSNIVPNVLTPTYINIGMTGVSGACVTNMYNATIGSTLYVNNIVTNGNTYMYITPTAGWVYVNGTLNATNIEFTEATGGTGYINYLSIRGITGGTGYFTNLRNDTLIGVTGSFWGGITGAYVYGDTLKGYTGFFNTVSTNKIVGATSAMSSGMTSAYVWGNTVAGNTFSFSTLTGQTGTFTSGITAAYVWGDTGAFRDLTVKNRLTTNSLYSTSEIGVTGDIRMNNGRLYVADIRERAANEGVYVSSLLNVSKGITGTTGTFVSGVTAAYVWADSVNGNTGNFNQLFSNTVTGGTGLFSKLEVTKDYIKADIGVTGVTGAFSGCVNTNTIQGFTDSDITINGGVNGNIVLQAGSNLRRVKVASGQYFAVDNLTVNGSTGIGLNSDLLCPSKTIYCDNLNSYGASLNLGTNGGGVNITTGSGFTKQVGTGLQYHWVESTTTGGTSEGGLYLKRGDTANGYSQVHHFTGTSDFWATGMRAGNTGYHIYDNMNGTDRVTLTPTLATINSNAVIGGNPTAPTSTTQLNINSSTQNSARIVLSGQEFYAASNTSTDGICLLSGVNRSGNRQLWIGDSANLTQNSTNAVVRIINTGRVDCIATDGGTNLPLTIGSSAVTTIDSGGLKFTNSTSSYSPYQLNYYEWSTSSTITTSGCTAISFTFYFTWQDRTWSTNSSAASLTCSAVVPSRFRSAIAMRFPVIISNFNTNNTGEVTIDTSGNAVFYQSVTGNAFSSGTSTFSIYGTTLTWALF